MQQSLSIDARQSFTRIEEKEGFQKHYVRLVHKELMHKLDGERIDMILWNSHDLGSSFRLLTGIYRYVCGNGLMVGSDFANFSHKHMGFDLEELLKSARQVASISSDVAAQVTTMKSVELRPEERKIFAGAALRTVYEKPEEASIRPDQLLLERRFDDKNKDLWTTFNVIQENVMKGGIEGSKVGANGRRRRTTTRPVKSIARDLKLNQAREHPISMASFYNTELPLPCALLFFAFFS